MARFWTFLHIHLHLFWCVLLLSVFFNCKNGDLYRLFVLFFSAFNLGIMLGWLVDNG